METRQDLINGIVDKLMKHESALSYSALSNFKESPKCFIDYKLRKIEQTDAMLFGSMVHCLILEPDDFKNRYYVIDDAEICSDIGGAKPRATNKYKEWYEGEVQKAESKTVIESKDFESANILALNVRYNSASSKVLKKAEQHEKPIEWFYKNFKFKGIIDGIGDFVFDLKTCADASPKKFQRDIISMDYYLQAAMYLKGIGEIKPYYIIALDKSGGVSVHQLTETLLTFGMEEYDRLIEKFNECILNDDFNKNYEFWAERWDGVYNADKPGYLY